MPGILPGAPCLPLGFDVDLELPKGPLQLASLLQPGLSRGPRSSTDLLEPGAKLCALLLLLLAKLAELPDPLVQGPCLGEPFLLQGLDPGPGLLQDQEEASLLLPGGLERSPRDLQLSTELAEIFFLFDQELPQGVSLMLELDGPGPGLLEHLVLIRGLRLLDRQKHSALLDQLLRGSEPLGDLLGSRARVLGMRPCLVTLGLGQAELHHGRGRVHLQDGQLAAEAVQLSGSAGQQVASRDLELLRELLEELLLLPLVLRVQDLPGGDALVGILQLDLQPLPLLLRALQASASHEERSPRILRILLASGRRARARPSTRGLVARSLVPGAGCAGGDVQLGRVKLAACPLLGLLHGGRAHGRSRRCGLILGLVVRNDAHEGALVDTQDPSQLGLELLALRRAEAERALIHQQPRWRVIWEAQLFKPLGRGEQQHGDTAPALRNAVVQDRPPARDEGAEDEQPHGEEPLYVTPARAILEEAQVTELEGPVAGLADRGILHEDDDSRRALPHASPSLRCSEVVARGAQTLAFVDAQVTVDQHTVAANGYVQQERRSIACFLCKPSGPSGARPGPRADRGIVAKSACHAV